MDNEWNTMDEELKSREQLGWTINDVRAYERGGRLSAGVFTPVVLVWLTVEYVAKWHLPKYEFLTIWNREIACGKLYAGFPSVANGMFFFCRMGCSQRECRFYGCKTQPFTAQKAVGDDAKGGLLPRKMPLSVWPQMTGRMCIGCIRLIVSALCKMSKK